MAKKLLNLRQAGYTLTEILLSLAIFSIVSAATVGLIWTIQSRSVKSKNALSVETEAEQFFRAISGMTRLAAKVADTDLVAGATNYPTGTGAFRSSFNFKDMTTQPVNVVQTLGVFLRENSTSNFTVSGVRSQWRATGLFFLPPTAQAPGVLYLTLGTQEGGVTTLRPSNSDITLTGVTEVSFSNMNSLNGRLVSLDMTVVYRIPLSSGKAGAVSWCPTANISAGTSGCQSTVPFKDVSRKINLLFSNNRLNHVIPSSEYTRGAYFFRPSGF